MRNLNQTEIKDILRHREEKLANIHKKMFHLYKEIGDTDEILNAVAFSPTALTGMPGGKGGHKDLGDVLLRYNWQIHQRNEDIRRIMWELVEEEDSISRVWACLHGLSDPYYSILHEVYVKNQLYQSVEERFNASHKTFERYRQRGMEQLAGYYNSGDCIAELMRLQKPRNGMQKIKKIT